MKQCYFILLQICLLSLNFALQANPSWDDTKAAARRNKALLIRQSAAQDQFDTAVISEKLNNGDEELYNDYRGNFCKALLHNNNGHVNTEAYQSLLQALTSGNPNDFNNIIMGGARKLTDPQASYSFSLQGVDAAINNIPPAPTLASAQAAGEMVENYWHALLRDIPFNQYDFEPLVAQAIQDLNNLSDFRGPKQQGLVVPRKLFKLEIPGACVGPYISQFLYLPIPNLGGAIQQVKLVPIPGIKNDFLTQSNDWFVVNNGGKLNQKIQFSSSPTFIRTARDLGDFVHLDFPGQAFFQAALILSGFGSDSLDDNHPYKINAIQDGFVSYGITDLLSLICRTAELTMKAVWHQKWLIHRRLRPEEFGYLINKQIKSNGVIDFGIHPDVLNSDALIKIKEKYNNYLLPQQYPEGCPTHPSYPCGHGTISAACATILKAWFKEDFIIPNALKPNNDNTSLVPCPKELTVGGELNKLVSNISKGRDIAGVHYRSDCEAALELGEAIALSILEDEAYLKNINFNGFSLTKFDGTTITITGKKTVS